MVVRDDEIRFEKHNDVRLTGGRDFTKDSRSGCTLKITP